MHRFGFRKGLGPKSVLYKGFHVALVAALLFPLLLVSGISSDAHAYLNPDELPTGIAIQEDIEPKTLKVKFTSEAADEIDGFSGSGFGSDIVDELEGLVDVKDFQRVYPYAGSFESRHRDYELHQYYLLTYGNNVSETFVKGHLESDADVELVEYLPKLPDYVEDEYGKDELDEENLGAFYDDPNYPIQWNLESTGPGQLPSYPTTVADKDIDFEAAMGIESGDPSVIVAVADFAIETTHPDYVNNIYVNPGEIANNSIDDDNNGFVDDVSGWDFYFNDNNPNPDTSNPDQHHGTIVTGIIASVGDNGIGAAGIAGGTSGNPGVKFLPLRGAGYYYGFGMVYAMDLGAKIFTMTSSSGPATEALHYYNSLGGIAVISANNTGAECGQICAGYYTDEMIAVGSMNFYNIRSSHSSFGPWLDVAAPGSAIPTTYMGGYTTSTGTSVAAPHVSAVLALMQSYNGNLTGRALRWILEETADDSIITPGFDIETGWGTINANDALSFMQSPPRDYVAMQRVDLNYRATSTPGFVKKLYISNITNSPITIDLTPSNATISISDNEVEIPAYSDTYVDVQFVTPGIWDETITLDDGTDTFDVQVIGTYAGSFNDTFAAIDPLAEDGGADWGDYDSDGDMDLILNAYTSAGVFETQIYRNDGSNTFTKLGTTYPGVSYGSVSWGDYDNDSDLDFVLSGYDVANSQNILKVYKNTSGSFSAISYSFDAIRSKALAWGDYDSDGDLDLFISGLNSSDASVMKIYKNTGSDSFSDQSHSLPTLANGGLTLGDADKDGDLDVHLTGIDTSNSQLINKIYFNSSNSYSSSLSLGAGLKNGSADFGDFNFDGRMDLVVTGTDSGDATRTRIYRNVSTNTYSETNIVNTISPGKVKWGDYDNDGDLDILLTNRTPGIFDNVAGSGGSRNFNAVRRFNYQEIFASVGQFVDFNNDSKLDLFLSSRDSSKAMYNNYASNTNTAPGKPTGLYDVVSSGKLTMNWTAPSDDRTATAALTYNIRVSTIPNTEGVKGSMSLANGTRKIVHMGNVGNATSYTIDIPSGAGNLFWEVQAVDSAYKGGEFEKFVPLAVEMDSYSVTQTGFTIVRVDWETASEINNLGFNIYRSTSLGGTKTKLNTTLIDSESPGSGQGEIYDFSHDDSAYAIDTTYYFWIESVDLWGNTKMYGPAQLN